MSGAVKRCQRPQSRPIRATDIEQAARTIYQRLMRDPNRLPVTVFRCAGKLYCAAGNSAAAALVNESRVGLVCNYARGITITDIIEDLRDAK